MDDSESKWEIQEYYSSSKEEEDEDEASTVVQGILATGYVIGREIVVTGIAVSSAQLVLPPLMVFSAMGVALSVSFGVLFASYACTNKIMSLLLPIPPSPPMLEYYADEVEQDIDENMDSKLGLDDDVETNQGPEVEGYVTDEEDNHEQMEDVNQGLETEIVFELDVKRGVKVRPSFDVAGDDDYRKLDVVEVKEDDYGPEVEGYVTDKEDNHEQMEDTSQGVETEITNVDEDVDERESLTGMEDDMIRREINVTEGKERDQMEAVKQGGDMRPSFDNTGDDQGYLEEDDYCLDEERKGNEPLVESRNDEDAKLRNEGRVDNTVKDDRLVSEGASIVIFGDVKDIEGASNVVFGDVEGASNVDFGDVKDVEGASDVAIGDVEDVEGASDSAFCNVKNVESASDAAFGDFNNVESASDVAFGDVKDVETTELVLVEEIDSPKPVEVANKNVEHVYEMRHTMVFSDKNNLNSSQVYELDLAAREVRGDADTDERTIKFDEKIVAEGSASKDASEYAILRTMQVHLIHSNAEAREIGDDNLINERSTNDNLDSLEGYEEDVGEYLEGDVDGLEEERKGKEPLVESWNDKNKSNTHEVNEDAKLRNERRADRIVSESASNVVFGDVKDVETTKLVTVKEIDSHKHVEVGNKNEEKRHNVVLSDENNLNPREVYTLDMAVREVIGDAEKDGRPIKFDETVVTESSASKDGASSLYERSTNNNNLESLEVGNEVKENAGDENVDTDNAKVAYKKMPSREENLDDEKIWEKIVAMRTIVGYKAPTQPTCAGELKALYVFTGVEPPASFEGDSDLDAKLKFLMAIVGVK